MSTIGKRMFKMKEKLLAIRIGPGAAVLPKDVSRIRMRFARKIDDGHRGPKHFWREYMPRLKFRNPAIPMTVDRNAAQSDPAIMSVYFSTPSTNSPSQAKDTAPTSSTSSDTATSKYKASQRVVEIQMKHRSEDEILQRLYEVTNAEVVKPTDTETEELRELVEKKERSRRDSERQAAINRQRKREAELLAAARGEINA
ncbi:uncharacterized protein K452DRAFT_287939 [Aplosporella prunicola CBS 121167]|uniref:Ribosomal protein/NADH dehydrogenase domain-containing protein n=1 Tax=Aplosporella prunicola CBS 121167 TaxID=1176127 RepID=A0A6A6BAJ2_9PEZI|nr:uncharacterized protein K452DRAFT_287939 [Aplosporella prunicola CBS 121167]KAF2141229.1 hypothetical protein K452DRAFT_287939 [Aplosporella prunicola CBS 121167]